MGAFQSSWAKLTERQKIVAAFAASWAATWILDRIADSLSGTLWRPLATAMTFLREYFLNGYVGCLLLGAILVGFWPNITYLLKKYGLGLLTIGIMVFVIATVVVTIFFHHYVETVDDPRGFVPIPSARIDNTGKPRLFTTLTADYISDILDKSTTMSVAQKLQGEKSKWIAIVGKLDEASPELNNSYSVRLKKFSGGIFLYFDQRWEQKLSVIPKDSKVYSVCTIKRVIPTQILELDNCELTQPAQ